MAEGNSSGWQKTAKAIKTKRETCKRRLLLPLTVCRLLTPTIPTLDHESVTDSRRLHPGPHEASGDIQTLSSHTSLPRMQKKINN